MFTCFHSFKIHSFRTLYELKRLKSSFQFNISLFIGDLCGGFQLLVEKSFVLFFLNEAGILVAWWSQVSPCLNSMQKLH